MTQKQPTLKQPKSLLWANARALLIVAFTLGVGLGVWAGYFGAISITNDMRRNFVTEQQAIATTVSKKAKE